MTDHWKVVERKRTWHEVTEDTPSQRVYFADLVDAARAKDAEAHARTLAEYDAVLKQRGYEIAEERGLRLSCEDMARMEIERLKADHAAALAAKDAEIASLSAQVQQWRDHVDRCAEIQNVADLYRRDPLAMADAIVRLREDVGALRAEKD